MLNIRKPITKAVIPVAGLGTRFLPITKTVPKEMLNVVDKPVLHFIVEEAINSGIKEILFIVSDNKKALEDYFDINLYDNEVDIQFLKDLGGCKFYYTRQSKALGLGHAILQSKSFISEDESFAVLLGDDLVFSKTPVTKQLINVYKKFGGTVLGCKNVDISDVSKYGIIDSSRVEGKLFKANSLIEKPSIEDSPSTLAIMGRYILNYDIFENIELLTNLHLSRDVFKEIQLTDAINMLANSSKVVQAYDFEGDRFDMGNKSEFVKAIIYYSLKREDLKDSVSDYIKELK